MSRPFDPDQPTNPPRDDSSSSDYATPRPNETTRDAAHNDATRNVAPAHRAGSEAAVARTEDYIEAEYVEADYSGRDPDASPDNAPHHTTMRDTLTRIPDALGAIGRDISRTLERAISAKDEYVVAVKVSAEAQAKLERLVQAGVFRTRAEAAAYLIDEGIEAQAPLFARVDQKITEIERLRAELRGLINDNPHEGV